MPSVHPSAILEGEVQLADEVEIGPHCVITGPVTIGPGTRLLGHVYLQGPLTLGANNRVYPFTCLGFAPQDLKWPPEKPGAGLVIGDENVFREHVSIHRATSEETPTTIGSHTFFMASTHAAHDCRIGSHCVIANGAAFAGFVRVDDRVVMGGNSTVHQFCRVGRGAMLSGSVGMTKDLPPFFMLTGINLAGSINLVGLRRSGASAEQIEDVRWAYKTLCRRGLSLPSAMAELEDRAERPMIAEYLDFLRSSKRGICYGQGKPARGTAVNIGGE